LFRSDDAGSSFGPVTLPTAGSVAAVELRPGTAYLGLWPNQSGAGGGLFRSGDGGATWQSLGAGTALSSGVTAIAQVGDRLVAATASTPGSPSLLWSNDGGATWHPAR
jgi:hypothetical protein